MGMRSAWIIAFVFTTLVIITSPVQSQENAKQVCFVYFTANCPNCLVADSYVDAVRSGYDKVVVIQYNVDDPSVNKDVLNAYKEVYEVDFNRPMVLFGVNDAYRGMDDIRLGLQKRVDYLFTQDGNECPLVDGTSIPANSIESASLPGQPEIKEIPWEGPANEIPTEPEETPAGEEQGSPAANVSEAFRNFGQFVSDPENYDTVIIVSGFVALVSVLVAAFFIRKRRHR